MTIYSYQAFTLSGELCAGRQEAASRGELEHLLAGQDLILKSAKAGPREGRRLIFSQSVGLAAIAAFNRQLVVLLKAGLTLSEAFATLERSPDHPRLNRTVASLRDSLERGQSFFQAAAQHPDMFDPPYLAMIATGENGGTLARCLERHQAHLDLQRTVRGKLRQALTYPAVLGLVLLGVLIFLFSIVIPSFSAMYADLGAELPLPTRILLAAADRSEVVAVGILGLVVSVWLANRILLSSPEARRRRDAALLRLPLIGHLRLAGAAAQAARILATLTEGGATVTAALRTAADGLGDRHVAAGLSRTVDQVVEGRSLSDGLRTLGLFPALSLTMIEAGEASGDLSGMLSAVADHHERALADSVATVTALVEPAMILVSGLVVGFIVVAMYLPIFSLSGLIG